MPSTRQKEPTKRVLLSSTALLCLGSVAFAVQNPKQPTPADSVLFSADKVVRKDAASPILAEGNVKAFFGDQALLADKVVYDPETDIVTAHGNVSIFDAEGQTYFADDVHLTGDLKDGVATNFSAMVGEQSRLASSTIVRRSNGRNDLNNAAFTACTVCNEDGSKKNPTWSVRARKVTQDTEAQMIRFRNASFYVRGVPVAYTPYIAFPDPSVKRKSGFLTPSIATSTRLGFETQVPYYWAISDHQDVTFSPRLFTELGVLVKGEYRVRGYDSGAVVQAGFIDPTKLDDKEASLSAAQLARTPIDDLRWHFFAEGFKELDNGWRADVDINYVSDKRYLRTYGVEPEGDLRDTIDFLQPDRLENRLSFSKLTDNSYTDVSTILFQSLRSTENNDLMADAMPRIRHERSFPVPRIGGEAKFDTDFLYLHRATGLDSMRLSGALSYEKKHTTVGGHRLRGFAELRTDYYRYTDVNSGTQACNPDDGATIFANCRAALFGPNAEDDFDHARLLPTAGVEWSYPLAKFTDKATFIVEPRVQVVVSPDEDFVGEVINEDSQAFQYDVANLFDWSKSTGLDQWEDGQRLNVGIAGQANYDNGWTIKGSLGQQFRANRSTAFDSDTGLGETSSDYVGDLDISFGRRFSLENSFRFDDEDLTMRRGESAFRGRLGSLTAAVSYLRVEDQTATVQGQRDEFVTAAASYRFNDQWLLGGTLRKNLVTEQTTNRSVLLQYRDDCTIFSLRYRFDDALGNDRDDNTSITFNVELAGL